MQGLVRDGVRTRGTLWLLCACAWGCTVRPQVDVFFQADEDALVGVDHLRVVVFDSTDEAVFERILPLAEADFVDPQGVGITLVSDGNVRSRTWRIVGTLEAEDERVLHRQSAIGSYQQGRRRVNLRFSAACEGDRCDSGACDEGACVDACIVLADAESEEPSARTPCGCDVALPGTPCESAGRNGRCWLGECCTGCFDGTTCVDTPSVDACGVGGAQCGACCADERCNAANGTCESNVGRLRVGARHACVSNRRDHYFCWGGNESGQLGDGTTTDRADATELPLPGTLIPGETHTCYFTYQGEVSCWGSAANGKLGFWDTQQLTPPTPMEADFTAMRLGEDHTCGIEDGRVICWGADGNGQRGTRGPPSVAPFFEAIATDFLRIAADRDTTCALRADNTMYCQGRNSDGQAAFPIPEGDDTDLRMAVPSHPDLRYREIDLGFFGGCGITVADELLCWGGVRTNILGEDNLALRAAGELHLPVAIAGQWSQVSVGANHVCAIRSDETLWCTGANGSGQLGVEPGEAPGGSVGPIGWRWGRVEVGDEFTCAQRSAGGGVYCWGTNANLQLGQVYSTLTTHEQTRVCFPP
ncbi:MAG: hypothetical protein AAGE52_07915 [Myxococcota bacterium]